MLFVRAQSAVVVEGVTASTQFYYIVYSVFLNALGKRGCTFYFGSARCEIVLPSINTFGNLYSYVLRV